MKTNKETETSQNLIFYCFTRRRRVLYFQFVFISLLLSHQGWPKLFGATTLAYTPVSCHTVTQVYGIWEVLFWQGAHGNFPLTPWGGVRKNIYKFYFPGPDSNPGRPCSGPYTTAPANWNNKYYNNKLATMCSCFVNIMIRFQRFQIIRIGDKRVARGGSCLSRRHQDWLVMFHPLTVIIGVIVLVRNSNKTFSFLFSHREKYYRQLWTTLKVLCVHSVEQAAIETTLKLFMTGLY